MFKVLTIIYSIWILSLTLANIQDLYPRTFDLERAKCEAKSGMEDMTQQSQTFI